MATNVQAMTPGRVVRLLLLVLPLIASLAGGVRGGDSHVAAQVSNPSIHDRHQSLPAPVHDEATCAFCQAAIFPPHVGAARPGVPDAPEAVQHEVLSLEERIPHSSAGRAPSSRAPPTLRCA